MGIMRNILSCKVGTLFTGLEINTWCKYQIDNNTSHKKEAQRISKSLFQDDILYQSTYERKNTGSNSGVKLMFRRFRV